ncbi:phosphatidylglycerol lysyltransferase domain-containing protein [Kitasatospora sp. NBC_01250]|uniref:phosphatidylglycerol lysyltransferase domain-containing protein n=1 Tax=unclassified Kitasatospora TaxID=2633591 RepID=UPI002E1384AD|nr:MULTISPECIES: phosphatidylglycerol lysyltransferase domain-containing protein [unclassified Kitasatospora]WSJ67466.1 phosphatidylglycerol lysyltransferase domain-containing protein [Kitasatospora sp. NBC_01302]
MWESLRDAYHSRIVEPGREPLFLLLIGLITAFLFIRFSTRMIRRGTSWWPGNVTPGGLHIHHVVFGQALMVVAGVASFAYHGTHGLARDGLAIAFGAGCGLVLDEFALVLHLEDVYWSEQGRKSVDAVILAIALIALVLVGELPLGGISGKPSIGQLAGAAVLLLLVVVSLLKGKLWTGLIGVMLPVLAVVGAIRLARPGSPWARWRYRSRPKRMARAERREARVHRRMEAFKVGAYNLLAGAPDAVPDGTAAAPAAAEAPAAVPVPVPAPAPARPLPPWRRRCAVSAEWYARIAAALNLLAGLIAPFRERVERANSGEFFTPVLVTAGFTAALFAALLAVMLRRRKRAAWIVATAVAAIYTVPFAVALAVLPEDRAHPFNWVSFALTALLLAVLLAGRRAFHARGARGNLVLGLSVLLIGGLLVTVLGAVLVHAGTTPQADWGDCFGYAVVRLFTVSGFGDVTAQVSVDRWADLTINVLGAALFLLVLRVFFRSPHGRVHLQPQDEQRLRALLERHGARDSLGYFALRRDKSVCWSPSGKAAVLYRVVNGVALASGDPIGDPEAWPQAIACWRELARANAWVPAVTGAGEQAGTVYRRTGLKALEFGDEAIVEVTAFSLEGRSMRTLRQAHNRVRKAGYRAVIRRHRDIPTDELTALVHLADAWRHGRTERGFSMALGRLGDPADGDCVLAECRDENDRTCALLSFVPWGAHGLSLDLMRRDRESENGLVEFLVTELLLAGAAGALPLTRVSLNFAMFRYVFEQGGKLGAGPVLRLCRAVLRFLSRWWQLESLYRANAKYQPSWEPRFLLYEKSSELPTIAVANGLAEGFLVRPRLRGSLRRGAAHPSGGTADAAGQASGLAEQG